MPLQVDGVVVIFDVETNGVAHKLHGHTRQIQSLRYVQGLQDQLTKLINVVAGRVKEDISSAHRRTGSVFFGTSKMDQGYGLSDSRRLFI